MNITEIMEREVRDEPAKMEARRAKEESVRNAKRAQRVQLIKENIAEAVALLLLLGILSAVIYKVIN